MSKKYQIIYADPPWSYDFGASSSRYVGNKYKTMNLEDMQNLPIKNLACDNSVLLMWATFPKLAWAIPLIESWGFKYKTCAFVWVKGNKRMVAKQTSLLPSKNIDTFCGMGYYTRSNAEICLLATKGKTLERKSHSVRQIIYEPIERHSKKPDIVKDKIIELFGDIPRIELFAREKTEGWDVWGNEVESDIEL